MAETAAELRERPLRKHSPAHNHKSSSYGDRDAPLPANEKVMAGDRERTHDGLSFVQYMIAGSIAGMVEHMAMFPIDTLKTRMQMMAEAGGSAHSSVGKTFVSIMKNEGPVGLYRGIGAMGLGAGPAHAVYFSVYETCKEKFGGNREGHHPLAHGAAGVVATVASDAVLTPMDVVKQRLQLPGKHYRGVIDCIRKILREEGLKAFYASYRTTVIMNAPYTAAHFSTYEAVKKLLKSVWPEKANDENFVMHLIAGGAAGAIASAITTPLDVVKTRLQCQGVNGAERFSSSSILDVVKTIVEKEGPKALWRGLKPRVLFHTPAAAICWSTYEASKAFLQRLNDRKIGDRLL